MKFSRREVIQAGVGLSALAAMPPVFAQTAPATSFEYHVFSRLAFGPRAVDFTAWLKLGPDPHRNLGHWLEHQLKPAAISDALCEHKIAAMKFTTLGKTMPQLWTDHVVAAEQMRQELRHPNTAMTATATPPAPDKHQIRDLALQPAEETEAATWLRAVYSERQLQEVLVTFWHNHFNIFAWEPKIAASFVQYDRDVIRKHALGNFREMLEDVAKSPAMLLYLDNGINQSGNPNENYARELFELHTLGAENYLGTRDRDSVTKADGAPIGYVDGDVYESARCFTGWRLDQGGKSTNTGTFEYFDQWHDRFQKVVLGKKFKEYQPPMQDGRDVMDLLAAHPGTARFVARKMCRLFVTDEPTQAFVGKIARVFHDKHKAADQIQHVVKAIVLSDEFKAGRGTKLIRPYESTVAFLRAMNADFSPSDQFLKNFETTGRRLFGWRTPDGYPDRGEKWMGTNVFYERWRLMNHALLGNLEGVEIDGATLQSAGDDNEFLNHIERTILRRPLSTTSRQSILAFLKRNVQRPRRYQFATGLAFMTPEMQWC